MPLSKPNIVFTATIIGGINYGTVSIVWWNEKWMMKNECWKNDNADVRLERACAEYIKNLLKIYDYGGATKLNKWYLKKVIVKGIIFL